MSATVTFAAVGSGIFTRRLSLHTSPAAQAFFDVVRSADVGFMNMEGPMDEPAAHPVRQGSLGPYFRSEQWLAEELRWAGFNLVSIANNHMSDYSVEAIETNQRLLREAGIAFSGAGRTLTEARRPVYIDLEHARVALISVDSSHEVREAPKVLMASDPRDGRPGRAGVNGLRWNETWHVSDASLTALRGILDEVGWSGHPKEAHEERETLRFAHGEFRRGSESGVHTRCHPLDLEDNLRWIRDASRQADYVLVSHHVHTAAGARRELPADFVVEFAHAAIDAGADVFLGHGDLIKGIELYRGKPIFWELGHFAWEAEFLAAAPQEAYEFWGLGPDATPADLREARAPYYGDDVEELRQPQYLATFTMLDGSLRDLQLRSVRMVTNAPRHRRGWPELTDPAMNARFAEQVARLSEPFGTQIDVRDGVGVVRLSDAQGPA